MILQSSQIEAILKLLSDVDPDIAASIQTKLFQLGDQAVQEVLREAEPGSREQREAGRILRCLQSPDVETQIRTLDTDEDGDIDLEDGAFTLAKFAYPALDLPAYTARLDQMAFELAPHIAPDDHPIHIIRILNDHLFEKLGFHGLPHFEPEDSFVNRVMDRKRGLPVALSAIYLFLARRLDLPIVGVSMPAHFILKFKGDTDQEILIDPFNRGRILTRNECAEKIGEDLTDKHLPEVSDRAILVRMITNLVRGFYGPLGNGDRAETLARFIKIIKS